ncbi:MAG TPA: 2-oxoacid:ferredoxin oxidoreductase subunit beta, partial [Cyclobacteriaceae bacterium]|nr:2-oxoacid:ferredoxin oxidoreductase subunit beta [Cyclobacteriaceae bacterium]
HGQPMLFGKDKKKGLRLNGLKLEVVTIGENGVTEKDILVHDAHEPDSTLHMMLVRLKPPVFPMVLGVIREVKAPAYSERLEAEIQLSAQKSKYKNMDDLLNSGETWEIK